MRHGKKFNHLGRKTAHRKLMLANMASSLILHKRITTTVAKAKALRQYIEPLVTKSKTDSTHSRRIVFSYLRNKDSVTELFQNVAEKVAQRLGGYTRIIKMTNNRLGDNAQMCMMEFVDYNELLLTGTDSAKSKTRRSRRGKIKTEDAISSTKESDTQSASLIEEAEVVEETTSELVEETKREVATEVEAVSTAEAEKKETPQKTSKGSEEEKKTKPEDKTSGKDSAKG